MFQAYRRAYKDLDDMRVDVRSPNNKHSVATDVAPRVGVTKMENWLKARGLVSDD